MPLTASVKVETGRVRVEDAQGQPPNIPFWFGEAPGRSDEMSQAVSRLRDEAGRGRWTSARSDPAPGWNANSAWRRRGHAAGRLPGRSAKSRSASCRRRHHRRSASSTSRRHPPGHPLALRQRDQPRLGPGTAQALLPQVQLRAAGRRDRGRDRLSLSTSTASRWPRSPATCIRDGARGAGAGAAGAPMFPTRWRWVATTALALPRFRNGKQGAAAVAAHAMPRTCWRWCSRTRSPAPRTSSAIARFPIIRWSARPCMTACMS
jgi:ATP-dependent Lhr-like helicase